MSGALLVSPNVRKTSRAGLWAGPVASHSFARWLCSLPAGVLHMLAHALLFLFGTYQVKCWRFKRQIILILCVYTVYISGTLLDKFVYKVSWHHRGSSKDKGRGRVATLWHPLIFMISVTDAAKRKLDKILVCWVNECLICEGFSDLQKKEKLATP